MRLWRGIGHGDPRLDARARVPLGDARKPASVPSLPVAAGAGRFCATAYCRAVEREAGVSALTLPLALRGERWGAQFDGGLFAGPCFFVSEQR